MSESIYAPPEADVSTELTSDSGYYVVAPWKFLLLSITTLGLYFVYFFLRNWSHVRDRDGLNIWPWARGLFYIFFTHSLFADVDRHIRSQGLRFDWNHRSLAHWFVGLSVLSNISERVLSEIPGLPPLAGFASLAFMIILPLLLVRAQRAINVASGDPEGRRNAVLTPVNWVWITLGGLLWIVMLIGIVATFIDPEFAAE